MPKKWVTVIVFNYLKVAKIVPASILREQQIDCLQNKFHQISSLRSPCPLNNIPLIPKVSFHYNTLASTNAEALHQINKGGAVAGAVYRAKEQSAGRGQGANTWHASPGANLTLSVVLTPDHLAVDRLFTLIQLTGLAVAETVRHCLPQQFSDAVRVKWPNDVYVGKQKVAGILVQNGLRGNKIGWSVLGIGLNVNEQDFPPSLQTKAVSLAQLSGSTLDLEAVAEELFRQLNLLYPLTQASGLAELDSRYHEQLYLKHVPSEFALKANDQKFRGIIRGVNRQGQLRIEQPVGREALFNVGEIRFEPYRG